MKKIKLSVDNQASFRFGDASGDLKMQFSSDQLVSALVNNVALLYGNDETEQFIEKMKAGEIKFSSLYYGLDFISKTQCVNRLSIFFLPRPKMDFIIKEDPAQFKKMKKISYVSNRLYRYLSDKCRSHHSGLEVEVETPIYIMGGQFALIPEELNGLEMHEEELEDISLLHMNTNPRVEVGRYGLQSENYFTQDDLTLHFAETRNYVIQPFMYFYYEGILPVYVQAAIHLLSDEGIGGRRSLGKGFFRKVEWVDEAAEISCSGSYYMNLSTYFPQKDELNALYSYELEKRNGFVYSLGGRTVRKKSVMTVMEGSLFTDKINGDMIDIRPANFPHPVYLNGKPLLVGFGGEHD